MANRFNVRPPVSEDPDVKAIEALHVKEIAGTDWEAEVVGAALPVVLDFYGKESKACEALAPRFAAVAQKFTGKVRFLKILLQANADLATKLGVAANPTLVFLRGGKEFGERLSGEEIQRSALKARVEALLGMAVASPSAPPA